MLFKHKKTNVVIEAERFDAGAWRWPKCVNDWPDDNGYSPVDASNGFIDLPIRYRLHVYHGHWLVKGESGQVESTLTQEMIDQHFEEIPCVE